MTTLEKILAIEADIANLTINRDELGKRYIDEKCPYKIGDRLVIQSIPYNKTENVIINRLFFDSHSRFEGLVSFSVDVYTKDFKMKAKNRNRMYVKSHSWENWQIIRHYKTSNPVS